MKIKRPAVLEILAAGAVVGAAMVTNTSGRHPLLPGALTLYLAWELYRLRRSEGLGLTSLVEAARRWLPVLSVAVLVALLPKFATQIVLGLGLMAGLSIHQSRARNLQDDLATAGITQFLSTWAIFLGTAIWHWPVTLVLVLVWLSSYTVAAGLMGQREERAKFALAAAWALIAAECAWIFAIWLVNYIVAFGYGVIPQAAVVLTALGYVFGGIYLSHLESKLSRARLIEYLTIGLVLIIIVITGTKWNGAI